MSKEKYNIGVIFCGGCNPYFDRESFYKNLVRDLKDTCIFHFYKEHMKGTMDLMLLINNCQTECLMAEDYGADLLLINNKNYEIAKELILKELRK